VTAARFVRRAATLLLDLMSSVDGPGPARPGPGVLLSASAQPPSGGPAGSVRSVLRLGSLSRQAEIGALVAAEAAAAALASTGAGAGPLTAVVAEHLDRLQSEWLAMVRRDPAARRLYQVAGLVLSCARGAVVEGLLTGPAGPAGLAAIDHLDFREWLAGHGAPTETLTSPLLRGMYDLVFAYQGGDPRRPRFAAGLGLFLAWKMFLEYRGSLFWKMRAGMGEVVFAPLYQALRSRGVRFEFFSRVARLHLSADRRSVAAVTVGRQARLAAGVDEYDPLVTVRGLPCFPAGPRQEQLAAPVPTDLESHWSNRRAERPATLRAGADFDTVILATSLGMVPYVCGELLADSPRWRRMVDTVATVGTQALQLWFRADDERLGRPPLRRSAGSGRRSRRTPRWAT
jgi:uncharacterized protein with NAD-binding domain and iron-sulfur cluster